jgi:hypothetical protein
VVIDRISINNGVVESSFVEISNCRNITLCLASIFGDCVWILADLGTFREQYQQFYVFSILGRANNLAALCLMTDRVLKFAGGMLNTSEKY